jgi:hypothetical protein
VLIQECGALKEVKLDISPENYARMAGYVTDHDFLNWISEQLDFMFGIPNAKISYATPTNAVWKTANDVGSVVISDGIIQSANISSIKVCAMLPLKMVATYHSPENDIESGKPCLG